MVHTYYTFNQLSCGLCLFGPPVLIIKIVTSNLVNGWDTENTKLIAHTNLLKFSRVHAYHRRQSNLNIFTNFFLRPRVIWNSSFDNESCHCSLSQWLRHWKYFINCTSEFLEQWGRGGGKSLLHIFYIWAMCPVIVACRHCAPPPSWCFTVLKVGALHYGPWYSNFVPKSYPEKKQDKNWQKHIRQSRNTYRFMFFPVLLYTYYTV